jgi:hypothetical protein
MNKDNAGRELGENSLLNLEEQSDRILRENEFSTIVAAVGLSLTCVAKFVYGN